MKESHIFYSPQIADGILELPQEEAGHAVRVLRMKEGDALTLTDGLGVFYDGIITLSSPKHCQFKITKTYNDEKLWSGNIHIAVAPTKNMDRMEWLTEKITEIGVDQISLLNCTNSERRVVKTERLEKITISAMKQSHKAFKPQIDPITPFRTFINQPFTGQRFIAHCYQPEDLEISNNGFEHDENIVHLSNRNFLGDLLDKDSNSLVLIGPEGDFSIDEVKEAISLGFKPISLGESRLRTETAALVAVHLMYLAKRR